MSLSPIVLFAYNRPRHLRRLLESLAANPEAAGSELCIFCDGPKADATVEDRAKIAEVRAVARERVWCGSVTVQEAETNRGLAASIVDGVRGTLSRADRVIVLEDDLILSPGFLAYMNAALDCYEADPRVMHVSGYMFPIPSDLPRTFFLRLTTSWGWATWRRAFAHFEVDAGKLIAQLDARGLTESFNLDGAHDYARQLHANAAGRIRTWAVQWYATVLLRDGLGLFPARSVVDNAGFDGSGVHCAEDDTFSAACLAESVKVAPIEVVESSAAREAVIDFLNRAAPRPAGSAVGAALRGWKERVASIVQGRKG